MPVISVDNKKSELIGNFKNSGTRYKKEADLTKETYQGEERPFIKYFCDPHKIDEELTKTEVQKIEDEVQLADI